MALLLGAIQYAQAQRGPVNGSGKIIKRTFDFNDFTRLAITDIAGKVTVEVGQPYAIVVEIDDNLEPLLEVAQRNGGLSIRFKSNESNRQYIENTNVRIKISVPKLASVLQSGNNSLDVLGLMGAEFEADCRGNGKVSLAGKVGNLTLRCSGNGTVNGQALVAEDVKIVKSGNGSVITNTDQQFYVNGSGNGDVINKGKGTSDQSSVMTGNGKIKYTNSENTAKGKSWNAGKKMTVNIYNDTKEKVKLWVVYPVQGNYGIALLAKETIQEEFPVGTRLFKGTQFNRSNTPIYTVTTATEQRLDIK